MSTPDIYDSPDTLVHHSDSDASPDGCSFMGEVFPPSLCPSHDLMGCSCIPSAERLDDVLDSIENTFSSSLPNRRKTLPQWSVWKYSLHVHRTSIYYAFQALSYSGHSTMLDNLIQEAEEWSKWNLIQSVSRFARTKATIEAVVCHVETLLWVECAFRPWSRVLRQAMLCDADDAERTLADLISSKQGILDAMDLNLADLMSLMGTLQSMVDRRGPSHRVIFRFLQKLVEISEKVHEYLSVTGTSRCGDNPVGGGGFSDVWKGMLRGQVVALKVLRVFGSSTAKDEMRKDFCREALIWRQFKHPNVLLSFGICGDDLFSPRFAMISPWMDNGDVISYLERNELCDRRDMICGIALGLDYLHELKPSVVHGDLRASNILVDRNGQPRLADFGLSRIIDSNASTMTATSFNGKGSMRWQAPELLDSALFDDIVRGVTTNSDVYAFALVCLEIFTQKVPFPHLRDVEVIKEVIVYERHPERPLLHITAKGLTDNVWEIMRSCWAFDPRYRPAIGAIAAHLFDAYGFSQKTRPQHDYLQDAPANTRPDALTLSPRPLWTPPNFSVEVRASFEQMSPSLKMYHYLINKQRHSANRYSARELCSITYEELCESQAFIERTRRECNGRNGQLNKLVEKYANESFCLVDRIGFVSDSLSFQTLCKAAAEMDLILPAFHSIFGDCDITKCLLEIIEVLSRQVNLLRSHREASSKIEVVLDVVTINFMIIQLHSAFQMYSGLLSYEQFVTLGSSTWEWMVHRSGIDAHNVFTTKALLPVETIPHVDWSQFPYSLTPFSSARPYWIKAKPVDEYRSFYTLHVQDDADGIFSTLLLSEFDMKNEMLSEDGDGDPGESSKRGREENSVTSQAIGRDRETKRRRVDRSGLDEINELFGKDLDFDPVFTYVRFEEDL